MYVRMNSCMYVCIVCKYACIMMYVCLYACKYVCLYACVHVCMYVYVCLLPFSAMDAAPTYETGHVYLKKTLRIPGHFVNKTRNFSHQNNLFI